MRKGENIVKRKDGRWEGRYIKGYELPGAFPAVEINYPKESKKEMRVLSREEQKRFVRYLLTDTDNCKFGVLLMLLSGIRIGELCALSWGNINLNEQTIRIAATLQRLHNTAEESEKRTRIVIGAPKSDTSVRTVPMTDYAAELCRRFAVFNSAAFILTGTGACMEPRTLQYRIEKYARDCGLEGVHAHTLRHTFATRAVEVGFEIKSLSEVLGHIRSALIFHGDLFAVCTVIRPIEQAGTIRKVYILCHAFAPSHKYFLRRYSACSGVMTPSLISAKLMLPYSSPHRQSRMEDLVFSPSL